jgi:hypothetical protein
MESIIIRTQTQSFSIEKLYTSYSPYLFGAIDIIDKIGGGGDVVIEDVADKILYNYLQFLKGNDFTMNKNDESFFEFMGHPNPLKYPLPYWKAKLQSKWVRDNFYKYKLCDRDNGLYGLEEITVAIHLDLSDARDEEEMNIDSEEMGSVLAGGAALYMSGISKNVYDLDFFVLDQEKAIKFISSTIGDDVRFMGSTNNSIYNTGVVRFYNKLTESIQIEARVPVSIIKRLYTCPSEVVHGFDIDASQFVATFKNGKPTLYATKIGKYAYDHREQWLDPELMSTTYIKRLIKYVNKGFKLRLPLINSSNLAKQKDSFLPIDVRINMFRSAVSKTSDDLDFKRSLKGRLNLPGDMGSLLIMIAYYGFTNQYFSYLMEHKEYDRAAYDTGVKKDEYNRNIVDLIGDWNYTNPMTQDKLSGVFYPTEMKSLKSLYKKSPLYKRK